MQVKGQLKMSKKGHGWEQKGPDAVAIKIPSGEVQWGLRGQRFSQSESETSDRLCSQASGRVNGTVPPLLCHRKIMFLPAGQW